MNSITRTVGGDHTESPGLDGVLLAIADEDVDVVVGQMKRADPARGADRRCRVGNTTPYPCTIFQREPLNVDPEGRLGFAGRLTRCRGVDAVVTAESGVVRGRIRRSGGCVASRVATLEVFADILRLAEGQAGGVRIDAVGIRVGGSTVASKDDNAGNPDDEGGEGRQDGCDDDRALVKQLCLLSLSEKASFDPHGVEGSFTTWSRPLRGPVWFRRPHCLLQLLPCRP